MSLNANNMQTLTTSIADQLFEIQGIGKYLKNPQCSQTSDLFQPSNEGWKNGNPINMCLCKARFTYGLVWAAAQGPQD